MKGIDWALRFSAVKDVYVEEADEYFCKSSSRYRRSGMWKIACAVLLLLVVSLAGWKLMHTAKSVAPLSVSAKELGNEEYVFGVALPKIVYSDEKKLILYDYRGIYVYDYEAECLIGFADFKSRDMSRVQGSEPTLVEVSEDGKRVRFYNQQKKYIFHTIKNQVKEVDEYKKANETFAEYRIEIAETSIEQGQITYRGKDDSLVAIALDYESVEEPDELKYHHLLVKKQMGGEEKIYRLFP